jgi:hypothetical protein
VTCLTPDDTHLTGLNGGVGPYAPAHTLRAVYHADVVALVTQSSGGVTTAMIAPSMAARDKAFLVAGRYPMGANFTLVHEVVICSEA